MLVSCSYRITIQQNGFLFDIYLSGTRTVLLNRSFKTKHRGLSPRANNTDRATIACRRNWCQHFVDRGCNVVNVMDPCGRILGFSDMEPLLFFQIAPQLYS
jgi:hypothetical protein